MTTSTNKVCAKHKKKPTISYLPCIGCELDRLKNQDAKSLELLENKIRENEDLLREKDELLKIANELAGRLEMVKLTPLDKKSLDKFEKFKKKKKCQKKHTCSASVLFAELP